MGKKLLNLVLVLTLVPQVVFSSEKTWTGRISDSMCGASHKEMAKEHQKEGVCLGQSQKDEDRICTLACIKEGGKYVLVAQGQVYPIENQDFAGLEEHAGHTIKLTGEIGADGKTIKVSKITT